MIILVCGGTAGHIFPANEVASALAKKGAEHKMVTDKRGLPYTSAGTVDMMPFKSSSRGKIARLFIVFSLINDTIKAFKYIKASKARAVVGFGGYITFPMILAAYLARVPRIIHEQNAVIGRANGILQYISNITAVSFINTKGLKVNNVSIAGIPHREFQKERNLTEVFTLLILGGSQGANFLSDNLAELIARQLKGNKDVFIYHQCREAKIAAVEGVYQRYNIPHMTCNFISNIEDILSKTHMSITRSGASTIADLAQYRVHAILVPMPTSVKNHQFLNAQEAIKNGGGKIIEENDDFMRSLETSINEQFTLFKSKILSRGLNSELKNNGTNNLVNLILNLI